MQSGWAKNGDTEQSLSFTFQEQCAHFVQGTRGTLTWNRKKTVILLRLQHSADGFNPSHNHLPPTTLV
jgi:hypothetical protein